ncbi:unnamed protein product [Mytilus coruscus]|uniref:Uncharacterized protein n=1 Tax=Mytilus coruscus TaxID=42192 RepID=A0A6J8BRL0_MYTCO|nr:unnamed protein product [Mytilus coruscus]
MQKSNIGTLFNLFDWFHEDNTKDVKEILRKVSLVEGLVSVTNSQLVEQLFNSMRKDLYFLNRKSPGVHVLICRLMLQFHNEKSNNFIKKLQIPAQEELVMEDTVSLEIPAVVQCSLEETPAAQEEAPVAQEGEQSAPVTASTTAMAFKKVIPDAWKGTESQVWTGPYSGLKERTWRVSDRDVACPVPESSPGT